MSHRIKKVEYLDGYKLNLHFDDKTIKEVDLSDTIARAKGNLLSLRDVEYFKKVKCDGITIVWPNGVDLCPDTLYKMGKKATAKTKRKVSVSVRRPRKSSNVKN